MISEKDLKKIREKYRPGTRVVLDWMVDIHAPSPGTEGTVTGVDDMGDILVLWSTGSTLKLIPGVDKFHVSEAGE